MVRVGEHIDGLHRFDGTRRQLVGDAGRIFHQLNGKPIRTFDAQLRELVFHALDAGRDLFVKLHGHRRQHGVLQKVAHGGAQFIHARAAGRDEPHHRATELFPECVKIDFEVMRLRNVEHIHHDNHRHAHFNELSREVEVAFEVGRVDDVHHAGRFIRQNVVAGDAFVFTRGTCGRNGINTGKINDFDLFVVIGVVTHLLFHGHAGPVADVLTRPGKGIKERRLTAVRVTDDADSLLSHIE